LVVPAHVTLGNARPADLDTTMHHFLAPASPVPLYFQLSKHLRDRIRAGEFDHNTALPTEDRLCADYRVSRTTVRQAMADLAAQRLILRRRGLGTFVAGADTGKQVSLVGSIHQALHYVKGLTYHQLEKKEVAAPAEVARMLNLPRGETLYLMQGVGMLDGEPLVYANLYFPERFGKLLAKEDFTAGTPVVHILEKRIGMTATRAEQIVEPDKADAVVAQALGIPKGAAILKITRLFDLSDGTQLEASITRYHPQRYKLQVELVERPQY
jgi:GntR family transcriptional regulator